MKAPPLLARFARTIAFVLSAASLQAETWHVFFGTGGPGADGIYRSTFDTTTGKLSATTRAAPSEGPGFLALHPDGGRLYAVTSIDKTPVVAAYRLGAEGALSLLGTSPWQWLMMFVIAAWKEVEWTQSDGSQKIK